MFGLPAGHSDKARIPSLDGLRAISIFMVLICHALPQSLAGRWPMLPGLAANGNLGVSVFFVISGYLITSLLLREERTTGSISLRNFYVRRFFRIVPPFYAFLLFVLLLWGTGVLQSSAMSFLGSMFFLRDYASGADWWTGHSWSLSIEEQFYLLWPAALAVLGRERAKKLAFVIVLAAPAIRVASHAFLHQLGPREQYMFHIRMDGLMLGCLLALYEGTPVLRKILSMSDRLAFIGIAFLALADPYLTEHLRGWYTFPFGYSIEYLAIAAILLYVVNNPKSWMGSMLNLRALVHVGVISYSLYLWQELFLTPGSRTELGSLPFRLLCCFVLAELSWRVVEKPALRLRSRFESQSTLAQKPDFERAIA